MAFDEKLIRKLCDGREFRRIDMSGIELKDEGERMCVEGYATTFNEPYILWEEEGYTVREIVDARAFEGCDMTDVILQYDHQGRVMARTRNNTLELTPDGHGLHVRADLGGTEAGRQLYEEIRGGYIDRMSFAFRVKSDEVTEERDRERGHTTLTRRILGFSKLYDVSAVSIPANDGTEISARTYADGAIGEAKALEERAARERQEREKALEEIRRLLSK